jgi:hypothetical protein
VIDSRPAAKRRGILRWMTEAISAIAVLFLLGCLVTFSYTLFAE